MKRDYGSTTNGSMYAGGGIGLGPGAPTPAQKPYPAPDEPGHDWTTTCPQKRAVVDLSRFAQVKGWNVRITHAVGCFPHAATAAPGPQRHSLAVRMSRGGERVVAVYVESGTTWTWATMLQWRLGAFPAKITKVEDMKTRLGMRP